MDPRPATAPHPPLAGAFAQELARELAAALDRGATILTASPFAAQWLTQAEDDRRRSLGATAWQAASISDWTAWTQSLWQQLQLRGLSDLLLLNPTQERHIARACAAEALASDTEPATSARLDTLAGLALTAWQQLAPYGSWQQLRPETGQIDLDYFRRWASSFASRCRTEKLLSPALLERELARILPQLTTSSPLPAELVLVSFEKRTPADLALETALQEAGVTLTRLAPPKTPEATANLIEAADPAEELHLAAQWLREQQQQNTAARLALLTCDLDAQRSAIARELRLKLSSDDAGIFVADQPPHVELAGGTSLAQQPAVRAALDLLRWLESPLPLERITALLLSPSFGSQPRERSAVASFDAYELRNLPLLQPELSLNALRSVIRRSPRAEELTPLQRRLAALSEAAESLTHRTGDPVLRTPADWAERIHRLLRDAEWSAAHRETTFDFQLRRRWESSLDQLASLDFDVASMAFTEARTALDAIVEATRFAPDWTGASIQVLSPDEIAGCHFDGIWVLGAGDRTWLSRPSLSPLLPRSLARELELPGANPEQHLRDARHLTARLLIQAPQVVFSYAKEIDGGQQEPSPHLEGIALKAIRTKDLVNTDIALPPVPLEHYPEHFAPSLPFGTAVRGGTDVLRAQAACSFQAFASYRLASRELDSPTLGWGAQERGIVLHKSLELIWQELKTSEALLALIADEQALRTLIRSAVDRAFRSMRSQPTAPWDDRYLQIERHRLQILLADWLNAETTRHQEFTVLSQELRLKDQAVGPLLLSITVDRIDEIGDGLLLLDYKSGAVSASMWQGDRLDQPQLPLYAVLQQEPVAGVAFASLRTGASRFLGYGADMNPPRSLPFQTLEEQLPVWRDAVLALAEAFATGEATVDPKNFPGTCSYCAQRLLCRVNPSLFDDPTEPETEATDTEAEGAPLG